jgi:hypothetical protein
MGKDRAYTSKTAAPPLPCPIGAQAGGLMNKQYEMLNLKENQKGKVICFYAPKKLMTNIDRVLDITGKTASEYLREVVVEAVNRAIAQHKAEILTDKKSPLAAYLKGITL